MKEIKEHMDLHPFAGRIVAFKVSKSGLYANSNALQIDDLRFGIVSKFTQQFQNGMGYNINILIPKDSAPCMNPLNNNSLFGLKFKARAASIDEIDEIKSAISSGKAVFEYMNKDASLNKVAEQTVVRSRL